MVARLTAQPPLILLILCYKLISKPMNVPSVDLDATCATLEVVAKQYPEAASEYKAVELAAKALMWIYTEGHTKAFVEALSSFEAGGPELSAEQEAAVRRQVFEKHGMKMPQGL